MSAWRGAEMAILATGLLALFGIVVWMGAACVAVWRSL